MIGRHPWLALALAGAVVAAPSAQAAGVQVMTQNQYIGTDILALVDTDDFNAAAIDALEVRAASLPSERVAALAKLIARRMPELVGLEEAYAFSCIDDDATDHLGCQDDAIAGAFTDQLADTLAALGGAYRAAAAIRNLDLTVPIFFKQKLLYVTITDRDVVLARKDVGTAVLPFKDYCLRPSLTSEGCNYAFVASTTLTVAGQEVEVNIERGYVGVFAQVGGRTYPFVVTHLETRFEGSGPLGRIYQSGQAAELVGMLQGIVAQGGSPIVVGDFNSDPRDMPFTLPPEVVDMLLAAGVPPQLVPYLGVPAYRQLAGSGFTDVWTLRPGVGRGKGAPLIGMTCCQDEDLGNHKSTLYERVDLIWSFTRPDKVLDARLLGESVADKTSPPGMGLWPSDHASVAATLRFGR
jgi:hypothetical protein